MKNKVLVIGETCTDVFVYGTSPRKSPEGNGRVFIPKREIYSEGMASNTANNLSALGLDVFLSTNNSNITKTRFVDETTNELYMRLDENDTSDRINFDSIGSFEEYDMVVISDYVKGFLTEEDIIHISLSHPLTICDTKKKLGDWCKDLKFIKINRSEYEKNKDFIQNNNWILEKLIITLDKDGCKYKDTLYPAKKVNVVDISGAGDTFVAGFVKKYIETKSIEDSILFGIECSSTVIQQKGVSVLNYG